MAGKNDWIANGKWLITEDERKEIVGRRLSKKIEVEITYFQEGQEQQVAKSIEQLVQKHAQYFYSGEIEKEKGVQPGEYGKQYPKEL